MSKNMRCIMTLGVLGMSTLLTANTALAANCLKGCPTGVNHGKTVTRSIYTLKNNATTKFADWVAYHVTTSTINGPSRSRNWAADPELAAANTLEPSDYDDAYATIHTDRGHQVPLAAFSNTADWRTTNYLSNITPQSSALNQGPWVRLETAVRNYVADGHDLYVVTGPLYESYFATLPQADEDHVLPSGYFKVVAEQRNGQIYASAFVMEQSAARGDNFCHTEVSINEVESRSGINFMPQLSSGEESSVEGSVGGLTDEFGC